MSELFHQWLVGLEYRLKDGDALPHGDQRVSRLHDWLADAYSGSAYATSRGWNTKVIVSAEQGVNSIDEVEMLGTRLIERCIKTLQLPRCEIVSRSAIDAETFVAELDVFGSRELATMLGVSRQRLAQLRSDGTLPEPDAVLAATPVWKRSTVDGFLWGWRRRPGPVPRAAAADMELILRGGL